MKLNHLAICARDVAASQDFYCNYFGFRQGPGPGLLASEEGFALAIHEVDEVPTLPACVHFGFFLATRAEAAELCERMRRQPKDSRRRRAGGAVRSREAANLMDDQSSYGMKYCIAPPGAPRSSDRMHARSALSGCRRGGMHGCVGKPA
jgi:catechol 2,3-dioxygenase-like lactoylglutathione lyase family enzyme